MSLKLSTLALAGAVCLRLQAAPLNCSDCHDAAKKVQASAHASVACQQCHPKHEQYPHPANIPKPVCANCHAAQAGDFAVGVHGEQLRRGNAAAPDCAVCHGQAHETRWAANETFHRAVPETCGLCHSQVTEEYKNSVHGRAAARGVADAPLCTDCHGEHRILRPENRASSVNVLHVSETCGRCHGDVRLSRRFGLPPDRVTSFDTSFHGLAVRAGSQTVANCASCHGIHNILPSSDPKSTIHARNLPATCGKCHPGAGSRFALGAIHLSESGREPAAVRWARLFYLSAIPLTIGLMLLHHGGDFIRKLIRLRLRPVRAPGPHSPAAARSPVRPEVRMYPVERIQHALLVLSFFVLVWTGFALKYPDQLWAKPLLIWEGSFSLRGVVHRVAAVVMMATAVAHLVTLIVSRRCRAHWLTLVPRRNDLYESLRGFGYSLGLISRKPALSPHSYIEKAEYWAVIWGTAVMAATGVLLWANNWALAWLPKSWLDLATAVHFYEAVLATLAIVVWHFYSVIFDPDVYPLDPAWLTGISVRRRESHEPKVEPVPLPQADEDEPVQQDPAGS